MKKKVNPGVATWYLNLAEPWVKAGVPKAVAKIPEDPNGVEIDTDDIEKIFMDAIHYGVEKLEALIGKLPEVEVNPEPDEPEPEPKPEYNTMLVWRGELKHDSSGHNKTFTWLDRTGSSWGNATVGYKLKFVWGLENGGTAEMVVPDSRVNNRQGNKGDYFDGTHNKPEESNGVKSSVFGPLGKRGIKLEIHYNR